jgi:hypothetical protein
MGGGARTTLFRNGEIAPSDLRHPRFIQHEANGELGIMRNQTESAQDSTPGIMPSVPWRVAETQILNDLSLFIRFVDGTTGEVDLSRLIMGDRAGVFAVLRDQALFSQANIDHGVVSWPGELDIAPDARYDELKEKGHWIPE